MSSAAPHIVKDRMDPARAEACASVLDRTHPGHVLPPFWHHLYFWDVRPPAELGRDGHIGRGQGLIPDMGLPRRMWAAGSLEWHAELRLDDPAEKATRLMDATRKTGRSGPLALVTLQHDIEQAGRVCLTERQVLVYREDPEPGALRQTGTQAGSAPIEEVRQFDRVTLMRYSSLTMNGHRIHWDEDYATSVEGHAGLVVHGPLLAEGLIDLATRQLGPLAQFKYRATSASVAGEPLAFCLDGTKAFVRGQDGRLCMEADVRPGA